MFKTQSDFFYIDNIEKHRRIQTKLVGIGRIMALTDAQYGEWLANLKDNDYVVLQEFHPEGDMILDMAMEYWRFSVWRIHGNVLIALTEDNMPINRDLGVTTYWNSDNPSGEVFPRRIIPMSPYFGFFDGKDDYITGQAVVSDRPVYEPLLKEAFRHVFEVGRNAYKVLRHEPYKYSVDRLGTPCTITHVFNQKEPEEMRQIQGYLYSDYLKRWH